MLLTRLKGCDTDDDVDGGGGGDHADGGHLGGVDTAWAAWVWTVADLPHRPLFSRRQDFGQKSESREP